MQDAQSGAEEAAQLRLQLRQLQEQLLGQNQTGGSGGSSEAQLQDELELARAHGERLQLDLERLNKELMEAKPTGLESAREGNEAHIARVIELEALVQGLRHELLASTEKAAKSASEADASSRKVSELEQKLHASGDAEESISSERVAAAEARASAAEALAKEAERELSRALDAAAAARMESESKLTRELEFARRELERAEQSRAEMAADLNVANRKLNGATERIVLMTGEDGECSS